MGRWLGDCEGGGRGPNERDPIDCESESTLGGGPLLFEYGGDIHPPPPGGGAAPGGKGLGPRWKLVFGCGMANPPGL